MPIDVAKHIFVFCLVCVIMMNCENLLCNRSLWSSNNNGNWTYSNNDCLVTSPRAYEGSILWIGDNVPASRTWHNYRITITFNFINGVDAGLIFRTQDCKSQITEGKKYILEIGNSYVHLVKTPTFARLYAQFMGENYFHNKSRTVTIIVVENRFTCFIDNKFIFEYEDNCSPIYHNGSVGIRTYLSTTFYSYFNVDFIGNSNNIKPQIYNTLDESQQNALINLYDSTNGGHWYNKWNLSQLKSNKACTSLCGIGCSINSSNHTVITSISLNRNNLSGSITPNIMNIPSLTNIDLSHNSLHGNIPNFFASFPGIIVFFAGFNALNSTLPESLTFANKLATLNLQSNNISGNLNHLSQCTSLREIWLDNNNLDTIINVNEKLENLTKLQAFSIRNNE
eukprot:40870_1